MGSRKRGSRFIAFAVLDLGEASELVVDIDDDLLLVRAVDHPRGVLSPPFYIHSFLAMAGHPGYQPLEPFERRELQGYRFQSWPGSYEEQLRIRVRRQRSGYVEGLHPKDRPALRLLWSSPPVPVGATRNAGEP